MVFQAAGKTFPTDRDCCHTIFVCFILPSEDTGGVISDALSPGGDTAIISDNSVDTGFVRVQQE